MIWGVGSGRCGTKSLAAQLDVPHEPFGYQPYESRVNLACMSRIPGVDFRYAYYLDDIARLDPEAQLAWVVRNPIMCVASYLAGNLKMTLDAASMRWLITNKNILNSPLPKTIYFTEKLSAWENKHHASNSHLLSREQARQIADDTYPLWLLLTNFEHGEHIPKRP